MAALGEGQGREVSTESWGTVRKRVLLMEATGPQLCCRKAFPPTLGFLEQKRPLGLWGDGLTLWCPPPSQSPGPEASQGLQAGYCGGDVGAGGQRGAYEPAR